MKCASMYDISHLVNYHSTLPKENYYRTGFEYAPNFYGYLESSIHLVVTVELSNGLSRNFHGATFAHNYSMGKKTLFNHFTSYVFHDTEFSTAVFNNIKQRCSIDED